MVKVVLYTPGELAQSSYVHTGFFELEKQKYLKCYVKIRFKKDLGTLEILKNKKKYSKRPHPKTSFYDVVIDKNKVIRIAIDLDDNPSRFSAPALKTCKYIFKRNFQNYYVNQLSLKHRQKLFPLGITTGCVSKSRHSTLKIYLGLFVYLLLVNIKFDKLLFSRLLTVFKSFKNNYYFDKSNRNIEFLRYGNIKQKKRQVFYQTRCFEDDSAIDTKSLHIYRNKIISQLKSNLGNNFKGGFIKSNVSIKNFNDNISNIKTKDYYKEIANSQITVYSNGLTTSPAWKLVEYLSKGNAIIAENINFELPFKLENNKHLIYFDNPNDCAAKAKKLIRDRKKISFLSKNALDYFYKYVDPIQNIKRIINLLIELEKKK